MTNLVQNAVSVFDKGFTCSQAIFSTFAPALGLPAEHAFKIAVPFGGGIARRGEICGAVSGAIMVLGLKFGTINAEDKESKELTYQQVRNFIEQFELQNGSIICKELLGYDINTPEGLKSIKERNLFKSFCPKLVQDAAAIVEKMIE